MFDADQIRAAAFIRHVEVYETLGSTNDRAAELARATNIELPALVVTRIQTAGRGRGKNVWWSAEGALTFSVLVDSKTIGLSPEKWPPLSLTAAVAVCDALQKEAVQATIGIKWPNDVLLDGKKVCGILIESPAPAKDLLIIGIGLNVNNTWRDRPRAFGLDRTALCDVTGSRHDRQAILLQILSALRERTSQLASGDAGLPILWQRLCWLTEKEVEVKANDRRIRGICMGVDHDGALLIKNVNGLHRIRDGTVRST